MNKNIQQNFQVQFNYNISFTEGVFQLDNMLLADLLTSTHRDTLPKVAVIIDKGLFLHHPDLIKNIKSYFSKHQTKAELKGEPLLVTGGEAVKNDWTQVDKMLNLLNDEKIDRHSYTIAIGGGAVLDTVGFACAIAHRGVRLIRIPTTVLSQNDSGVGVKNSVNYFDKKNFLGTFQPPFAVINDATFLDSLSDRDYRSGISEAIKVALIKDPVFFDWIEENLTELKHRDAKVMDHLIFRCAELHTEHIASGDPFELGSSRPLDFGHWAAHKLEYLTQYSLTHGEAVAIGIVLDACYSYKIGYLSEKELLRILNCFQTLGFNLTHPLLYGSKNKEINPDLTKGLEEFKEHLGGILTIMLLTKIGKGEEVHQMSVDQLNEAVQYITNYLKK